MYAHSCINKYVYADIDMNMCKYIHKFVHVYAYRYMRTYTPALTYIHTYEREDIVASGL